MDASDTGLTRESRATRQARTYRPPYHYPLPGLQRAEAHLVHLGQPARLTRFLHEAHLVFGDLAPDRFGVAHLRGSC